MCLGPAPGHAGLHSEDLRWRAIFKIWWDGADFHQVAHDLSAGPLQVEARWVRDLWNRFEQTFEVASHRGRGPGNRPPIIDHAASLDLIDLLLDSPEHTLQEHRAVFESRTGFDVPMSTFCQAVKRVGFSRQKLQAFSRGRDEARAAAFRTMVQQNFRLDQLLAVDETSKDRRSCQRNFGYMLRGYPPVGQSSLMDRGDRLSALCSFGKHGFVAWEYTPGTFNRERFLTAAESVVLDQVNVYPGPRSVVLIDNASIHKTMDFVNQVNLRGGIVLFTPPYCWDLTPLDNGAFGAVKRFLQSRMILIRDNDIDTAIALDTAFREAVNPAFARRCWYQCYGN